MRIGALWLAGILPWFSLSLIGCGQTQMEAHRQTARDPRAVDTTRSPRVTEGVPHDQPTGEEVEEIKNPPRQTADHFLTASRSILTELQADLKSDPDLCTISEREVDEYRDEEKGYVNINSPNVQVRFSHNFRGAPKLSPEHGYTVWETPLPKTAIVICTRLPREVHPQAHDRLLSALRKKLEAYGIGIKNESP